MTVALIEGIATVEIKKNPPELQPRILRTENPRSRSNHCIQLNHIRNAFQQLYCLEEEIPNLIQQTAAMCQTPQATHNVHGPLQSFSFS